MNSIVRQVFVCPVAPLPLPNPLRVCIRFTLCRGLYSSEAVELPDPQADPDHCREDPCTFVIDGKMHEVLRFVYVAPCRVMVDQPGSHEHEHAAHDCDNDHMPNDIDRLTNAADLVTRAATCASTLSAATH